VKKSEALKNGKRADDMVTAKEACMTGHSNSYEI